jgi:hypothetical protein
MRPTRSDASGTGSGGKRSGASAFIESPTSPHSTQGSSSPRTVIRGDGATHSTDEELARDPARTAALAAQGFALFRFAKDEVLHNLEGVPETIRLKLVELRPRIDDSIAELGAIPILSSPSPGLRAGSCISAARRQSRRHGATPHPVLPPQGAHKEGRNASDGSTRLSPTNGCVNFVGSSPRLRSLAGRRLGRGAGREAAAPNRQAPHPSPLPASGARELPRPLLPACGGQTPGGGSSPASGRRERLTPTRPTGRAPLPPIRETRKACRSDVSPGRAARHG